jgi:hypothetical protein
VERIGRPETAPERRISLTFSANRRTRTADSKSPQSSEQPRENRTSVAVDMRETPDFPTIWDNRIDGHEQSDDLTRPARDRNLFWMSRVNRTIRELLRTEWCVLWISQVSQCVQKLSEADRHLLLLQTDWRVTCISQMSRRVQRLFLTGTRTQRTKKKQQREMKNPEHYKEKTQ